MSALAGQGIRVLPPDVAARIAAGEVIERPASVVRELLDNAIDAGATRISVEVQDGGIGLIRVVDDGRGMAPGDIEIAFERHATSKISDLGDLANVQTLGFRGEALPSVAAAADVEVVSRVATEPTGVHVVLVDGRVARHHARAAPVGTSITVRDLFARLPARRKFLGTPGGEGRAIATLAAHYALAYPGIAFQLNVNGRSTLQTPGDAAMKHAFAAVHGPDAASRMLDVGHALDRVAVSGLTSPPDIHRGNRSGLSVFINGRWVQSRSLLFAAVDAYQSQLPGGRFPIAALAVSIPAEDVDVNVHPAKAEVRFQDERLVARAVREAISSALELSPVVAWLPRAPGEPFREGPSLRVRLEAVPNPLLSPAPLQARLDSPPEGMPPSGPGRRTQREVLPMLRVVGQMAATYVVCEGPDGMYLVDQHAAHERVMFDRLTAGDERAGTSSQTLLEPEVIELGFRLAATMEEHVSVLRGLGLDLEPFGDRASLVRAVPAGFPSGDVAEGVRTLLERLAAERFVTDPFERAAATVACHASVRAGTGLSLEEMRRLIEDLERTDRPRTCPHGRPTLIHVSTELIERQFGRR